MDLRMDKINAIYNKLKESSNNHSMTPIKARRQALQALKAVLTKREDEIFNALLKDLHKNRFESYVTEIAQIKSEIDLALKNLSLWSKKIRVNTPLVFMPGASFIEPIPKGLILIIAPWNYPIHLSLIPLVSAIAAGNVAIIKPSELAPQSAQVIKEVVSEALDENCFSVILGDAVIASTLLEKPFDHIFFTGSPRIGMEVMKKAASHLTSVTLELGGKNPCIVDRSADIKMAAKRVMWGKCLNAGQSCIAPDYIMIDHNIFGTFIDEARSYLIEAFGTNAKTSKSYGRIINEQHFLRLKSYLSEGRIILGGQHDIKELYIEPTILTDIDLSKNVMTEEIFGPILPVIPVDIKKAIAFINNRHHPLVTYIFASDERIIKNIEKDTVSGALVINDVVSHVGNPALPFGGVGHSGMGSYHGFYGFLAMSHQRSIYRRSKIEIPLRYPPFTEQKLKVAKIFLG